MCALLLVYSISSLIVFFLLTFPFSLRGTSASWNEFCGACLYCPNTHMGYTLELTNAHILALPAVLFFPPLPGACSCVVEVVSWRSFQCVRQKYVRIAAHWAAVVLNERKEEGDHTLTPAGCGDSPVERSQDRWMHSKQHWQLFSEKHTRTNDTKAKIHLIFFWLPGVFQGIYAPRESKENAAEMSVAWLAMLLKDPLSW